MEKGGGDGIVPAVGGDHRARARAHKVDGKAARAERLGFEAVQTPAGRLPWDATVRRFEVGTGYSVVRNVTLKASWQRNLRSGGRIVHDTLWAGQIVYWF